MKKLSKFQKYILDKLKSGLHLQCNEGKNYKAWFILPDGTKQFVRRDSASKVVSCNMDKLNFGETINWKK